MNWSGICVKCFQSKSDTYPCDCFGDYKVGDVFERKDFEYTIMSKHYNMDDSGNINGCVYLVRTRRFGEIDVSHTVAYDGYYEHYKKVRKYE